MHKDPNMDYEDGFGISSGGELEALNKALEVGYVTGVDGTQGADALRVQSLEGSFKVLTFSQKNAVLWQKITKVPAYSTVEEYNELNKYGADGNSFLPAGTAPEEDDSEYTRRASYVKYMGTLRKVSHPTTLVRTMAGDIIARENQNGILKLIRDIENALFWADSTLKAPALTTGYEFDGLNKLIDSANYIDAGGADLSEGMIEDTAELIVEGYGIPSDLFLGSKAGTNFTKSLLPKGRAIYPNAGANPGLTAGAVVNQVATNGGLINLNPSVFLNAGRSAKTTPPAAATSTKAPTAPASITAAAMTGSTGKFRTAQEGVLNFKVTACNRFGESQPTAAGGTTTVSSADHAKYIPLTITNAASVVTVPDWYNVYATEPGGSTYYLVAQVPVTSGQTGNNGTTVYNYLGLIMANTSTAFMGDMTEENLIFKQLAPLMQMDLARTDPNIRWMILLYGMVQLFAPKKWARIINIK